jgi:hypothetical protein
MLVPPERQISSREGAPAAFCEQHGAVDFTIRHPLDDSLGEGEDALFKDYVNLKILPIANPQHIAFTGSESRRWTKRN